MTYTEWLIGLMAGLILTVSFASYITKHDRKAFNERHAYAVEQATKKRAAYLLAHPEALTVEAPEPPPDIVVGTRVVVLGRRGRVIAVNDPLYKVRMGETFSEYTFFRDELDLEPR